MFALGYKIPTCDVLQEFDLLSFEKIWCNWVGVIYTLYDLGAKRFLQIQSVGVGIYPSSELSWGGVLSVLLRRCE